MTSKTSADLDVLLTGFRAPAARTIAERLLSGRPMTREQLVEGLDVNPNQVNRAADQLATYGYLIEKTPIPGTNARQWTALRPEAATYPSQERHGDVVHRTVLTEHAAELAVEGIRTVDGRTVVDVTWAPLLRSASLELLADDPQAAAGALFARNGNLTALLAFADGTAGLEIHTPAGTAVLGGLRLTAEPE